MTSLTRWNPLPRTSILDPIGGVEDIFRGLGIRPFLRDNITSTEMRIDVTENDDGFQVRADLPGVGKDDIEVSVEGNQVVIGAEVRRETKDKDKDKDIYTERYYGQMYRRFSLPSEVDSDKASARYDKGVLELTLPKKKDGRSHKLSIS